MKKKLMKQSKIVENSLDGAANKDICCRDLEKIILDPEFDVRYTKNIRLFIYESYVGRFCVFCGTRIPKNLDDGFFNQVVLEELGFDINAMSFEEYEKLVLPKEFQTDEWWLKRQHLPNFPRHDLTKSIDDSASMDCFKNLPLYHSDTEAYCEYYEQVQLETQAWKDNHFVCCWSLLSRLIEPQLCRTHFRDECCESLIAYEPEKRRFLFRNIRISEKAIFFKKKPLRMMLLQLNFCHWCGAKFPKSLAREWFEIATKQFGVKNIYNQKELAAKLPAEYLTQEWWFSRGL